MTEPFANRVSIVIPVFDKRALTEACLDALHRQLAFGHHAPCGEVADPDPVFAGQAIHAQLGHDEQAVARDLPMLVVAHFRLCTPCADRQSGRRSRAVYLLSLIHI